MALTPMTTDFLYQRAFLESGGLENFNRMDAQFWIEALETVFERFGRPEYSIRIREASLLVRL